MRLTLRTLLAYLDDVLIANQSKEIGQKIQESPVAQDIIERLREVTRKRRLDAPGLDDTTLDLNTTAEYLDNTLAPDKVAGVEQLCLDREEYLAEVASTHQILTMVLGEPVEVNPQTRQRMYSLGEDSAPLSATIPTRANASAQTDAVTAATNSSHTVPDYLKPAPWPQRFWPGTLVVALAIGWLYVFFTDTTFQKNVPDQNQVVNNTEVVAPLPQNVSAPAPAANSAVVVAPAPMASSSTVAVAMTSAGPGLSAPATSGTTTLPANTTAPNTVAMTEVPPTPAPAANSGTMPVSNTPGSNTPGTNAPGTNGEQVAMNPNAPASTTPTTVTPVPINVPDGSQPTPPKPNTEMKSPTVTPEPVPVIPASSPIPKLVNLSNDNVLIRQVFIAEDWYEVMKGKEIFVDELLGTPPPFRDTLEMKSLGLSIELDGGTVCQFMQPTLDTDFGLQIKRGRVVLKTMPPADPATAKPIRFYLKVGVKTWPIILNPGDSFLGFEVIPRLPQHLEEDFGTETHAVTMRVDRGTFQIKLQDNNDFITLKGPQLMTLAALQPQNVVVRARDLGQSPLSQLNSGDWMVENTRQKTTMQKKYAKEYLAEFDVNGKDEPEPVWLNLTSLVTGDSSRMADFAVEALTLKAFSKGDDADLLVMALARSDHEDARKSAIDGLREWLPTDPQNRILLRNSLQTSFSPETALLVYQLLWGYNTQDLHDPIISHQLIDLLLHEHIAVRELTIYQIERLTNNNNGYKALERAGSREAVVRRWKLHVDREGALIK
jgi:hypothetical protein